MLFITPRPVYSALCPWFIKKKHSILLFFGSFSAFSVCRILLSSFCVMFIIKSEHNHITRFHMSLMTNSPWSICTIHDICRATVELLLVYCVKFTVMSLVGNNNIVNNIQVVWCRLSFKVSYIELRGEFNWRPGSMMNCTSGMGGWILCCSLCRNITMATATIYHSTMLTIG